ncbi:MAG TPA: HNH endonuclease signature motif containing protein [Vicinamibacteria bacterium]|nr:HNH endonuclease signature motif containing protein [Vicinamibacteria bacterium]
MNTNMLAFASGLSDRDLLARVGALAGKEREATAELVAHLAALDDRPSLYAAGGYGSLFDYCTQVLRLSEDAACNRIHAARACRSFPVILDHLASGAMSLTSVRLLRPHLTPENHEAVLARACGRRRREIEALVAELAPRPDVPSSVRKVPTAAPTPTSPGTRVETNSGLPSQPVPPISAPPPLVATRRPIIETTSPERYRVQFTIGKESHDKLRRVQDLLRREIPDGDPAAIFDRAVTLLLEKVEKAKLGAAAKPRARRPIRPGTDRELRTPIVPSRDVPREVQRGVWRRDGGQCGFVAPDGHRCTERTFLELHHIRPYALGGLATVENISLRCRRHNQYEAERVFGPGGTSVVSEAHGSQPEAHGFQSPGGA